MAILLYLVILFLLIMSRCIILSKAGREWWEALIPVYGSYMFYKIAQKKGFFWASLFAYILLFIYYYVMFFVPGKRGAIILSDYAFIILGAVFIIILASNIALASGICHVFDLGGGFFWGLLFLSYVFYPIIAFSEKYEYMPENTDENNSGTEKDYDRYEEHGNNEEQFKNYWY